MAILGITTPLDDDVGMLLEKRNDLLRCGNLLSLDDATHRLVDYLPEDADSPLEITRQGVHFCNHRHQPELSGEGCLA